MLVGYRPGELGSQWSGIVAVALACLAWAIDTNLNQRLSLRDPVALAGIKGLLGGFSILAVALLAGEARPSPGVLATGLALGTITYGVSMVLFFRALRQLGTARVAAYFATGNKMFRPQLQINDYILFVGIHSPKHAGGKTESPINFHASRKKAGLGAACHESITSWPRPRRAYGRRRQPRRRGLRRNHGHRHA